MGRLSLLPAVAVTLAATTALALPAGERGSLDVTGGLGAVTGIAASDSGDLVAASDRDLGGIYIWHEAAFSTPVTADGCTGAESVAFVAQATLGDRFYVGCDDGVVLTVEVDSSIPPVVRVDASIVLNEGIGTVTEVGWISGDTSVHAVVQDGSSFSLHRFTIADPTNIDGSGLPVYGTGTISAMTVGVDTGAVILADTNGSMSWVSRTGTYSVSTSPPSVVQGSTVDLATSSRLTTSWWADRTSGDIWTLSNTSASTAATRFVSGLADPSAIGFVYDGFELHLWVGLQDGTIDSYGAFDGILNGVLDLASGYATEFAAATSGDDPVFAAGSDSTVRVITDRPWINDITTSATSVQDGDSFTLTFTPADDGDYDVRTGGPDVTDGSSLATGTATAETEVSVSLSVDDLADEGDNRLFVYLTDSAGNVGKDSVVITRDTPPDTVTGLVAEGGANKLVVSWTSSDEPDISSYEVYISDEAFTAEDDLPVFAVLVDEGEDTEDTIDYPATVPWSAVSTGHSLTIEGLVNETTYYLTVVTYDSGDLDSGPATVVTGVPIETCAASECAGDTYGCTCAPNSLVATPLTPGALALGALLLAMLVPVLRRR